MKTRFFAAMMAVVATAAISTASAQTVATISAPPSSEASDKMYRPQKFTDYAFEGILLSVDQQAKVDAVNAEFKAKREGARAERKLRHDRKQLCKGDSACAVADRKDCPRRECDGVNPRMQERKDYVGKMKQILTPEQYTTFLENIVFMPQPGRAAGAGIVKDKMRKGSRKDFKGAKKEFMKERSDKKERKSDK